MGARSSSAPPSDVPSRRRPRAWIARVAVCSSVAGASAGVRPRSSRAGRRARPLPPRWQIGCPRGALRASSTQQRNWRPALGGEQTPSRSARRLSIPELRYTIVRPRSASGPSRRVSNMAAVSRSGWALEQRRGARSAGGRVRGADPQIGSASSRVMWRTRSVGGSAAAAACAPIRWCSAHVGPAAC